MPIIDKDRQEASGYFAKNLNSHTWQLLNRMPISREFFTRLVTSHVPGILVSWKSIHMYKEKKRSRFKIKCQTLAGRGGAGGLEVL